MSTATSASVAPCWFQSNGLHVLVVDDYADNAVSMAMLLRLYGYQVEIALNGPAALRSVEANVPHVVFIDISMPGMTGYEVARQLRSTLHERVFLIAVTANGSEEDKRCCYEAGFDRHFTKPANPADLENFLRELAALRQLI